LLKTIVKNWSYILYFLIIPISYNKN
jgi:hypothetical protein